MDYSKSGLKKALLAVDQKLKLGKDKLQSIRLSPVDKSYTSDDFINSLIKLNINIIEVVNPGGRDSYSSKYKTYVVNYNGFTHYIVLTGGSFSNKGMTYERGVLNDIINSLSANNPNPLLTECGKVLNTQFVDVEVGFTTPVRRHLSSIPYNIGDKVTDITLIDANGIKHFISLKYKNGKTISNNSLKGLFKLVDEQVHVGENIPYTDLINAAKIDLNLVVHGLNSYLHKQSGGCPERQLVNLNFDDTTIIKNYIACGIGYGYIYVKNTGVGKYEIIDLTTLDNTLEFIGDIQTVELAYPMWGDTVKRKQLSIIVKTTTGKFTFDMRNTSGELLPTQINLVRQ